MGMTVARVPSVQTRFPGVAFVFSVLLAMASGTPARAETFAMSISCTGTGETCVPPFSAPLTVTQAGPLKITVTAASTHCSNVSFIVSVDGSVVTTTPFLTPGQRSGPFASAAVTIGTHTITVQAVGTVGGCNSGTLYSWGGTLVVRQTTAPTPVNYQQMGPGVAESNGGLHFNYTWGSTTGNVADLTDCEVGEDVMYPSTANPFPWPSPPYLGSWANPTIRWVPATDGAGQDVQLHPAFLTPYVANAVTANQTYRYKCGSIGIVDFGGWLDIAIARTVSDSTGQGCWGYTVTKSGYSASVSPLPKVKPVACQSEGANDVPQRVGLPKNSGDEIGLSVSFSEASVGLNAPIFFDLKVFNRRAETVGLDLGLNRKGNLQLTISEPGGVIVNRMLNSQGFGRLGEFSLPPGGAFVETLLLNEWYEFRRTGTYRIKMTLLDGLSSTGRTSIDQPSTEFSVQVGSRDPARLERVCEGLAERAIAGATLEDRMEAASALSYIQDPLAVASLVRVLQNGSLVEHYAVDGLGRIGGPEAIAALLAAQDHPDEEVRAAVRLMLGMI